jgi:hypothetical protein
MERACDRNRQYLKSYYQNIVKQTFNWNSKRRIISEITSSFDHWMQKIGSIARVDSIERRFIKIYKVLDSKRGRWSQDKQTYS